MGRDLFWQTIDDEDGGERFEGEYAVDGKELRVRASWGAEKSAMLQSTPARALARMLLWELIREHRGTPWGR